MSAEFFGQVLPTVPVVLGQAIFERNDGIIVRPLRPEAHHVIGTLRRLVGLLENIFAILVKLAGGGIERDGDFFAGLVAGLLNGFEHDFDGFDIRFNRWRKPAFVADSGVVAALLEHAFQRVKNFDAPAQRFGKRFGPTGMTMNSWKSTLLSACAPPLRIFIIGTGRVLAAAPPR